MGGIANHFFISVNVEGLFAERDIMQTIMRIYYNGLHGCVEYKWKYIVAVLPPRGACCMYSSFVFHLLAFY